MDTLQAVLWYVSAGSQALLVWRLARSGLFRRYRWFTAFLVTALIRTPILMSIGYRTPAYDRTWLMTELFILALEVCAVHEAYRMTMECHANRPGEIARVLILSLAVAACFVFGSRAIGVGWWDHRDSLLRSAAILKRSLLLLLLALMGIAAALMRRYPTAMSSNLRAHRQTLTLYLAQSTAAMFFLSIAGQRWTIRTNIVALAASVVCFACWMYRLSPSGEKVERLAISPEFAAQINETAFGYLDVGANIMRQSLKQTLPTREG